MLPCFKRLVAAFLALAIALPPAPAAAASANRLPASPLFQTEALAPAYTWTVHATANAAFTLRRQAAAAIRSVRGRRQLTAYRKARARALDALAQKDSQAVGQAAREMRKHAESLAHLFPGWPEADELQEESRELAILADRPLVDTPEAPFFQELSFRETRRRLAFRFLPSMEDAWTYWRYRPREVSAAPAAQPPTRPLSQRVAAHRALLATVMLLTLAVPTLLLMRTLHDSLARPPAAPTSTAARASLPPPASRDGGSLLDSAWLSDRAPAPLKTSAPPVQTPAGPSSSRPSPTETPAAAVRAAQEAKQAAAEVRDAQQKAVTPPTEEREPIREPFPDTTNFKNGRLASDKPVSWLERFTSWWQTFSSRLGGLRGAVAGLGPTLAASPLDGYLTERQVHFRFKYPVTELVRTGTLERFNRGTMTFEQDPITTANTTRLGDEAGPVVQEMTFTARSPVTALPIVGNQVPTRALRFSRDVEFDVRQDRFGQRYLFLSPADLLRPLEVHVSYVTTAEPSWEKTSVTEDATAFMEDEPFQSDTQQTIEDAQSLDTPDEQITDLVASTDLAFEHTIDRALSDAQRSRPPHLIAEIDRRLISLPGYDRQFRYGVCHEGAIFNIAKVRQGLGLPARYVMGYQPSGSRELTNFNAHAYMEVFWRDDQGVGRWVAYNTGLPNRVDTGLEGKLREPDFPALRTPPPQSLETMQRAQQTAHSAARVQRSTPKPTPAKPLTQDARETARQAAARDDQDPAWREARQKEGMTLDVRSGLSAELRRVGSHLQTLSSDPARLVAEVQRYVRQMDEKLSAIPDSGSASLDFLTAVVELALDTVGPSHPQSQRPLNELLIALTDRWAHHPGTRIPLVFEESPRRAPQPTKRWYRVDKSFPMLIDEPPSGTRDVVAGGSLPSDRPRDASEWVVARDGAFLGFTANGQIYDTHMRPLLFPPLNSPATPRLIHVGSGYAAILPGQGQEPARLYDPMTGETLHTWAPGERVHDLRYDRDDRAFALVEDARGAFSIGELRGPRHPTSASTQLEEVGDHIVSYEPLVGSSVMRYQDLSEGIEKTIPLNWKGLPPRWPDRGRVRIIGGRGVRAFIRFETAAGTAFFGDDGYPVHFTVMNDRLAELVPLGAQGHAIVAEHFAASDAMNIVEVQQDRADLEVRRIVPHGLESARMVNLLGSGEYAVLRRDHGQETDWWFVSLKDKTKAPRVFLNQPRAEGMSAGWDAIYVREPLHPNAIHRLPVEGDSSYVGLENAGETSAPLSSSTDVIFAQKMGEHWLWYRKDGRLDTFAIGTDGTAAAVAGAPAVIQVNDGIVPNRFLAWDGKTVHSLNPPSRIPYRWSVAGGRLFYATPNPHSRLYEAGRAEPLLGGRKVFTSARLDDQNQIVTVLEDGSIVRVDDGKVIASMPILGRGSRVVTAVYSDGRRRIVVRASEMSGTARLLSRTGTLTLDHSSLDQSTFTSPDGHLYWIVRGATADQLLRQPDGRLAGSEGSRIQTTHAAGPDALYYFVKRPAGPRYSHDLQLEDPSDPEASWDQLLERFRAGESSLFSLPPNATNLTATEDGRLFVWNNQPKKGTRTLALFELQNEDIGPYSELASDRAPITTAEGLTTAFGWQVGPSGQLDYPVVLLPKGAQPLSHSVARPQAQGMGVGAALQPSGPGSAAIRIATSEASLLALDRQRQVDQRLRLLLRAALRHPELRDTEPFKNAVTALLQRSADISGPFMPVTRRVLFWALQPQDEASQKRLNELATLPVHHDLARAALGSVLRDMLDEHDRQFPALAVGVPGLRDQSRILSALDNQLLIFTGRPSWLRLGTAPEDAVFLDLLRASADLIRQDPWIAPNREDIGRPTSSLREVASRSTDEMLRLWPWLLFWIYLPFQGLATAAELVGDRKERQARAHKTAIQSHAFRLFRERVFTPTQPAVGRGRVASPETAKRATWGGVFREKTPVLPVVLRAIRAWQLEAELRSKRTRIEAITLVQDSQAPLIQFLEALAGLEEEAREIHVDAGVRHRHDPGATLRDPAFALLALYAAGRTILEAMSPWTGPYVAASAAVLTVTFIALQAWRRVFSPRRSRAASSAA